MSGLTKLIYLTNYNRTFVLVVYGYFTSQNNHWVFSITDRCEENQSHFSLLFRVGFSNFFGLTIDNAPNDSLQPVMQLCADFVTKKIKYIVGISYLETTNETILTKKRFLILLILYILIQDIGNFLLKHIKWIRYYLFISLRRVLLQQKICKMILMFLCN